MAAPIFARCGRCYYWHENKPEVQGNNLPPLRVGDCRRHAPRALVSGPDAKAAEGGKTYAYWPVTYHEEWCAEGAADLPELGRG